MINNKITKSVAVAICMMMLTGSLAACDGSSKTETSSGTTTSEVTVEVTTTETEETEETASSEEDTLSDEEQGGYTFDLGPDFVSTNGELEGMDEYMILCSEDDWSRPSMITDLNDIEDEDLRELAQSYEDEGYTIIDRLSPQNYGDYEYTFCRGFSGQMIDDGTMKEISVWKMNETLFNYFVLGRGVWWNDDEGSYSDDGTVIKRYREFESAENHNYACFEFNRDTGIMTFYYEDTNEDNWHLLFVNETIHGDEDINAVLAACYELGYQIMPRDIGEDEWIDYEWEGEEYQLMVGFEALYSEEGVCITIRVFKMDEDCFENAVVGRFNMGTPDFEVVDDGTVIRYIDVEYGGGYVYEYNRDTGVAIIYNPWFDDVGDDVDSAMVVEGLDEIHNC